MCPSPLDDAVVRLKESVPKLIAKAQGGGGDDPDEGNDVVELTTLADQIDAALDGETPAPDENAGRVDPGSPAQ